MRHFWIIKCATQKYTTYRTNHMCNWSKPITYYSGHQIAKVESILGNHRTQNLSHRFCGFCFQPNRSVNGYQVQSENRKQGGFIYSLAPTTRHLFDSLSTFGPLRENRLCLYWRRLPTANSSKCSGI